MTSLWCLQALGRTAWNSHFGAKVQGHGIKMDLKRTDLAEIEDRVWPPCIDLLLM